MMTVVCVVISCATIGFVRAPFPRWVFGEVIEIIPERMTLVIREDGSKKPLSLRWDQTTRLWIQPTRSDDRGAAFDPKELAIAAPVRIMFKKYSDHNLLIRVIRLACSKNIS